MDRKTRFICVKYNELLAEMLEACDVEFRIIEILELDTEHHPET